MRPERMPPRVARLSPAGFVAFVVLVALVVVSAGDVAPSFSRLAEGLPKMENLLGRMLPPNLESAFLERVGWQIVETFQIALVGTAIGILLSLPIAWLASRRVSPLGPFSYVFKGLVSFFRTVPDLVWGLLFVSTIGLGAVAGTTVIIVDTIGFCGRFFAEAMDDADREPQEALSAIGANRVSILFGAVLPDAAPSMINTSIFSLEKAVRSSVILGVVGAGGIGQELDSAFDLFQYQNAATIIIAMFIIVMTMEILTDWLRKRVE